MLDLTCAMWDDPLVYHYQELQDVPDDMSSVFLAGPSSREDVLEFKWRPRAVELLRLYRFTGVIVVPEPRENDWSFKETFPTEIVSWERKRLLLQVKKVVFWIPRHQTQLPGRVTNIELGFLAGMSYADPERYKKRLVWGYPETAWKVKSEDHWVHDTADIKPWHHLEAMCKHVADSFK
jgi:hypothetical protein